MKILLLGGGAWGTALAVSASRSASGSHDVSLWLRDAQQAQVLRSQHRNPRYLPGVSLPSSLTILSGDLEAHRPLWAQQDLLIVATPMAALRPLLLQLRAASTPLVWLCKGFEAPLAQAPGLLGHEVALQVAPTASTGVLSGPSFAVEVAQGQPTALVAASSHSHVRAALVAAFHCPTLRVYASDDVVGVEVGGAVKNVLAIATGLCDGMQLGLNARAALITRGLAEMTRLGLALGAQAQTFMGLSGLGDLVLTATGDLSRNRKVGQLLAQGHSLDQAVASLGHVAEGVYSARTLLQRARTLAVDMPITEAVVALLDGRLEPRQTLQLLMQRDARTELG